ncbi:hypothetical protein NDU88_002839 [Pleurodeles waltl]|uniref:Uncharacterized protein n=1 Tax=Pleurodeles waltl TaxID=8319 RepID=A0AAV7Q779_PLEWA|nr:hypothetical protein NDU88_002839 [Pleurodeles waltl]
MNLEWAPEGEHEEVQGGQKEGSAQNTHVKSPAPLPALVLTSTESSFDSADLKIGALSEVDGSNSAVSGVRTRGSGEGNGGRTKLCAYAIRLQSRIRECE